MNEQLLTIALLIIVVCNLGALLLYFALANMLRTILCVHDTMHECQQTLGLVLVRLSEAADRQRGMKQALLEDGKLTRERIAQVKTRLADEERDDQREKRHARSQRQR